MIAWVNSRTRSPARGAVSVGVSGSVTMSLARVWRSRTKVALAVRGCQADRWILASARAGVLAPAARAHHGDRAGRLGGDLAGDAAEQRAQRRVGPRPHHDVIPI